MAEAKTSKETEKMKTKTKISMAGALVLLFAAFVAPSAQASFGFEEGTVDSAVNDAAGHTFTQAAGHPVTATTEFRLKTEADFREEKEGFSLPEEAELRNVTVEAPPGLIGNPTATPRCDESEFLQAASTGVFDVPPCPDSTQVGIVQTAVDLFVPGGEFHSALYNLQPQPGQPALFGFYVATVPVLAVPSIRESDYGIDFNVINIDQSAPVLANEFVFWGDPASPIHDEERGNREADEGFGKCGDGRTLSFFDKLFDQAAKENHEPLPFPLLCSSGAPERAFLTLPSDCEHGPFDVPVEAQSWIGTTDRETITSHDNEGNPVGVTHCERVPFKPSIAAEPSTKNASSASGLTVDVKVPETGLLNPEGVAQSTVKKAEVTLPEGFTLNPSAAEGIGVCSEAQYEAEKVGTEEGQGCPNSSRLGSVTIESPLLEHGELVEGSVYVAEPDDPAKAGQENPFDSLVAIYMVARAPERGVIVKSAGKVELDPTTGLITTTFDNLPQLPFSDFKLRFREGGRAPLVTPPNCGDKTTVARFYPYSAPAVATTVTSTAKITNGLDGGACPPAGVPPFHPGFQAGARNNNAGSFSPFDMRLTRSDAEQDMTKFSAILPPGELGSLAGVSKCPDSAIAIAKAKSGKAELASPSCPANSLIGHSLAGAGVGSVLTYVGGQIYLGGPYHGDPLSVIAITPAVAGPFDAGTVVVQEALTLNPKTAEVEVDGAASDPIPHILKGIVLKLRDLRVYVDRPNFTLNPTSCEESSAKAVLFGSYLNPLDPSDDKPVGLSTRYQAANCANLGFKPKLALDLKGGTKRGGHPGLTATYTPRKGDANVKGLVVRLPRSAFLDQAHIKTICTRVQFAAGAGNGADCPKASRYGFVKAYTPLLDEPLEGPVFLRSSSHKLPDMVFALRGLVDVEVATRIDSARGGIRATVEEAPDAPISKVVLRMQGATKGLIVNSKDLCAAANRANVHYEGHNGKTSDAKPVLQPDCGGKRKGKHKRG